MNILNDWLSHNEIKNITTTSSLDGKDFHHLSTPLKVKFSSNVIKKTLEQYNPKLEKGGLFVGSIQKNTLEGEIIFVDEVIFISNIHPEPKSTYRYSEVQLKIALEKIFWSKKIPFLFHTHPTASKDLFIQQAHFLAQLNTSLADKKASFSYTYTLENLRLTLPCILVVANGEIKTSLFIGFYNGLIAPTEFKEHRDEIIRKTLDDTFAGTAEFYKENKTLAQIIIGLTLIGIVYIAAKHPKALLTIALAATTIAPTTMIATQKKNLFMGISSGQGDLLIEIPELTQALLEKHEKTLKELKEI